MRNSFAGLKRLDLFSIVNAILLLIITLVIVYPFYNTVVLSFNDGQDTLHGSPMYFLPRKPTLENYTSVMQASEFFTAARNTIIRTVVTTSLSLIIIGMFAYALTNKKLLFRRFYMIFSLITMYFSGGIIPTFLVIRDLGLYNNFLVYIFPHLFDVFYTIIFISFFKALPSELEESAYLDGANDLVIFFRIILPVSTPVFASIAIYSGVAQWNSWFDCMLYIKNENLQVLAHLFARMVLSQRFLEQATSENIDQYANMTGVTSISLQVASLVLTTFPIMVIYPFLQKYFVKGIMIGSVKG